MFILLLWLLLLSSFNNILLLAIDNDNNDINNSLNNSVLSIYVISYTQVGGLVINCTPTNKQRGSDCSCSDVCLENFETDTSDLQLAPRLTASALKL